METVRMNKHADIHTDSYLCFALPWQQCCNYQRKNLADHWKTCSKGMELKTGFKYIWNPAQESGDPEWRRHTLTHCTHGQLKIRVRKKKKKRKSELEDKVWLLAHCSFSHQSHPSSWDLLLSFQEEFEILRGKMLAGWLCLLRSSVQFSLSVVSDSLRP